MEFGGEQPSMQRKNRTSHENSKPWEPWGSSVGKRLRRPRGAHTTQCLTEPPSREKALVSADSWRGTIGMRAV